MAELRAEFDDLRLRRGIEMLLRDRLDDQLDTIAGDIAAGIVRLAEMSAELGSAPYDGRRRTKSGTLGAGR